VCTATWGYPFGKNPQNSAAFQRWCNGGGSLKLKSVSTALKMAACQWIMTSILGDHQCAEMLMSFTKCRHWSWRTIVWLSRKLLMRLESTEVLQTQFQLRIWPCEEWPQNLCPSCFRQSGNNSVLRSHRTCWSVPTGILSSWRLWSLVMYGYDPETKV
jgi:hypothetical protein